MIAVTAIYHQICLTNINLQHQYQGFIDTPQIDLSSEILGVSNFDFKPANLELPEDFEMPQSIRLGQRMEFFMQMYLIARDYKVLAQNLQVIANKLTLGELDFIIENQTGERIHLEMVYKFYLYRPELEGNWIERLIGPNAKDALTEKVKKLSTHQFPMLQHPETEKMLHAIDILPTSLKQQFSFKAQVYIPLGLKLQHLKIPHRLIAGYYYTLDQLLQLKDEETTFYIPSKNDWVGAPTSVQRLSFDHFFDSAKIRLTQCRSFKFWIFKPDGVLSAFATWW